MATLTYEGSKFIFRGSKEERFPPKEAGWLFDAVGWKDPHWSTVYVGKVKTMIEKCRELEVGLKIEDSAKDKIRELESVEEEKLNLSRSTNADIDVPIPDGLEYFPFQKAGIDYALKTDNVLIADEMGLGKTIQVIGIINKEKPKKVLIIVPASLKLNWKKELKKWLVDDYSISMIDGKADFEADIIIINYDRLVKHREELTSYDYDILVLDESHYVKNNKAQRTRATISIARRAKKKIFLTGSPILNRPIELYTPLRILGSEIAKKGWENYAVRYCNGHRGYWGWDVSGASNTEELNKRLRSTVMVRRLKKDVLTELPSKIHSIIPIEAERKEIRDALKKEREQKGKWALIKDELKIMKREAGGKSDAERKEDFKEQVANLRSEIAIAFTEIAQVRHGTALAKVPEAIDFIRNILEIQDKVIVYTHHKDVLDKIYQAFPDMSVKLTGDMDIKDRQESIERFQADDKIRLFLGTILAAGLGITLTASSTVIFVELEWTPAQMAQAEDRCHRIGQRDVVNVYHLVVDDSIDAELANMLIEKQKVIDQVLDEEVKVEKTDLTDVESPKKNNNNGLEKLAEKLDDDDVERIHRLLQQLAGTCDGAVKQDCQGFNSFDTAIGKDLARAPKLSKKQAALGYVILKKYHGQIGDLEDFKKLYKEEENGKV